MEKIKDKSTFFSTKKIFDFNGKKMDFTSPRVMGIVNVTPDSFYQAGKRGKGDMGKRRQGEGKIIGMYGDLVGKMVGDGAYIIDMGAVSTRPGAAEVNMEEEQKRLVPVLKEIRMSFPDIIISIDTYRSEIARMAAGEGADMINDISGGAFDPLMHSCIVNLNIPYVIMHIQGTPSNMQENPVYENVSSEVFGFLLNQAVKLHEKGHNKIILDPGFGFGKTVEHNFILLRDLGKLAESGYPVLSGLSRKSMINRVLSIEPDDALNGTTVLNTIALMKGASLLRVHDVKEATESVRLMDALGR